MTFYTIKEAIRRRLRLKLYLADGEYIVEPHVLGRDLRGKTLLRAYQLLGPEKRRSAMSWKVFDLTRIRRAIEAGDGFDNPRPGYKLNDPTMKGGIIECV